MTRLKVSIHAPRVGGDRGLPFAWTRCCCFNPRPPCGGRPARKRTKPAADEFQSTPPVWGATQPVQPALFTIDVSIHAPRVGGDTPTLKAPNGAEGFNPRPPCGGRQARQAAEASPETFQSTPPVWGATNCQPPPRAGERFQSTPPVWGATDFAAGCVIDWMGFNPRPPCGGRRCPCRR